MYGTQEQNILKPSVGKLFFLCGFSILLSSFGPMFVFSAAPLTLGFLIYGPRKSFLVASIFLTALVVLTYFSGVTAINTIVFVYSIIYAVLISESIKSKVHPTKILMMTGSSLVILFSVMFFANNLITGFSLDIELERGMNAIIEQLKTNKDYSLIMSQTGEDARALQDFVRNPQVVLVEILSWLPATIFVSIFFSLWMTLFVVMRNSLVWKRFTSYPWRFEDLLNFKTPEFFVWPVILSLLLAVGGDLVSGEELQLIGFNALYCFGIFYFFQGVGVYLEALNFFKIFGFIRLLFIISMLFFAWKVLMFIGLFDNWINFRKFLKNKKEGDIL